MPLSTFKTVCVALVHGCGGAEKRDLNKVLFKREFTCEDNQDHSSTSIVQPTITFPPTTVFLHFSMKEASGIPLLGMVLAQVALQLSATRKTQYRVDMEFPVIDTNKKRGQRPACDGALCVSLMMKSLPVALFEYKPSVDPRWARVDPDNLMELVLQGYYCLREYSVTTILHCLTDVQTWWYFLLRLDKNVVVCDWYKSFTAATPENFNINAQVAFLDHYLTLYSSPTRE